MKKMNRKGFTIVELVIVIAVIAILAGVMIPTFSGVVNKAKESAALQEAGQIVKTLLIAENGQVDFAAATTDVDYYVVAKDYVFSVTNGTISESGTKISATTIKESIVGNYTEYCDYKTTEGSVPNSVSDIKIGTVYVAPTT